MKLWIVGRGELSSAKRLGPSIRLLAFAKLADELGIRPVIVVDKVEPDAFPGIELLALEQFDWNMVDAQDKIVATPHLPWRLLFPLLRGTRNFDVDSHGIGALEGMESGHGTASWRLFQGRRRTALRLRLLLHACEKIYLSIPEQLAFLGGCLFRESRAEDVELASRLPEKALYAPMGVNSDPFPSNPPSVWPHEFGRRPIFLWGGGIWSWFDIPTLLQAFSHLADQGSPAILYFLAGKNPSGLSNQDAPVRLAREEAQRRGLLGKNVFFHDSSASPDSLPSYLAGCHAGILANPAKLESLASWRTRLLDLLWAGKPAVVSGDDPLSRRMADAGCAIVVPTGDALALAKAVQTLVDDSELWLRSAQASRDLATRLGWSTTLASVKAHWSSPVRPAPRSPVHLIPILRCLAGF